MTAATTGGKDDVTGAFNCREKRVWLSEISADNINVRGEQTVCARWVSSEDTHLRILSFKQANDQRTCASRASDHQDHVKYQTLTRRFAPPSPRGRGVGGQCVIE